MVHQVLRELLQRCRQQIGVGPITEILSVASRHVTASSGLHTRFRIRWSHWVLAGRFIARCRPAVHAGAVLHP